MNDFLKEILTDILSHARKKLTAEQVLKFAPDLFILGKEMLESHGGRLSPELRGSLILRVDELIYQDGEK